ncbi:hypothetical protein [Rhizobium sp. BR 315]|uniref:hypothetical protein n=1 Tax=Rhizobium sp. BR 315 TaxID=3040014 RepID=UPI003D32FF0C
MVDFLSHCVAADARSDRDADRPAFFQAWTTFAWPMVINMARGKCVLEVGLALFQTGFIVDLGRLSAAAALSLIPSVIFFGAMRRNFVKGVATSGMKE